ncbi:MAG: hypothetical protein AAGE01_01015 [Pseudomonadota bacterium]
MRRWIFGALALSALSAVASERILVPLDGVSAGSLGSGHGCAVADGRAHCWGNNDRGQTGRDPSPARGLAESVYSLPPATAVAAGGRHSCAIVAGTPWCWGANDLGQLGDGRTVDRRFPEPVDAVFPGPAIQLVAGANHTCALIDAQDGQLFCWGSNRDGQLGVPAVDNVARRPVSVDLASVTALSSTVDHTCAIASGLAYCWGRNDYGQAGSGAINAAQREPVAVVGLEPDQVAIGAGDIVTCALDAAGVVRCLGSNYADQLGVPAAETPGLVSATPVVAALAPQGIVELLPGFATTCVATPTEVYCWGLDGSVPGGPEPRLELAAAGPADGFVGHPGAFCFIEGGNLRCVGDGRRLAQGSAMTELTGTGVLGLEGRLRSLSLGFRFGCGVLDTGALHCWGANAVGQLGQLDRDAREGAVVVPLPADEPALDVSAGYDHACATTQPFRNIVCWGNNRFGALGDGTTEERLGPVEAMVPVGGRAIVRAGNGFTCATVPLGSQSVFCWGRNDVGQLGGEPTSEPVLEPVEIVFEDVVFDLHVGDRYACAEVSGAEQEVWCWGELPATDEEAATLNAGGAMPAGPRRFPGQGIETGGPFSFCFRSDGQLLCTGRDYFLQSAQGLLRGDFVGPRIPQVTGGLSSLYAVGGRHSCWSTPFGQTRCLNLLGRSCRFERATGLIQTPGQGISCEYAELTLDAFELTSQPIECVPPPQPELFAAGYDFACGSWGDDLNCWGVNADGQLGGGERSRPEAGEPVVVQRAGAVAPAVDLPIATDPALACPAFVVGSVRLRYPESFEEGGSWGLEMLFTEGDRRLQGGLNFGGYAVEGVPGFAAFDVNRDDGQATVVTLSMTTDDNVTGNADFDVTVRGPLPDGTEGILFSERIRLTDDEQIVREVTLRNGFHVVALAPVAPGDELFLVSATARAADGGPGWFSSGAVVGGQLRGIWSGFAAVCTDRDQPVMIRTEGRSVRGSDGAGDLRLEVFDGQTGVQLYDSVLDGGGP